MNRGRWRAVWTVGDQVVASAQTFAVSLAVTHATSLGGAGAFAIAFVTYQLLIVVSRAVNSDPLTVGFAASDAASQQEAASGATGGSLVIGLLAGLGCAAAGLIVRGSVGPVLLVLALGVPAFLLQDSWRFVSFMTGRPSRAFVNDGVVLIALGPACWVAARIAPHSASGLVGAWGAATGTGAILGALQAGIRPAPLGVVRWWRTTIHLGGRMLGENFVAVAAYGAGILAIAVGASVGELGRLRTAQVSLGAVSPLIIALSTIVATEGTRLLARNPIRFPQLVRVSAFAAAGFTAASVAFWLIAPPVLGRTIVGPTWDAARPLVLAGGAYLAAAGVTLTASGALRALRRPKRALLARSIAAPATVMGGIAGAVWGGAGPAMLGIAAGESLCALLTVLAYRSVWRIWKGQPWSVGPLATAGTESPAGM